MKIEKIIKRKQKELDKVNNKITEYYEDFGYGMDFTEFCENHEIMWEWLDKVDELESEIKVLQQWGK